MVVGGENLYDEKVGCRARYVALTSYRDTVVEKPVTYPPENLIPVIHSASFSRARASSRETKGRRRRRAFDEMKDV